MTDLRATLAAILADPEAAARRRAAEGGRVVGVLGGAAPAELIAASGALPVRLRGQPDGSTERADDWMEPVQEGGLRTTFDRLLSGRLDWLDMIVVPRSSEQLLQFYHLVEHVRREAQHLHMPPLHLVNILQTPTETSARFDRAEMETLRDALADLTGRAIDDATLRETIRAGNAARRRFQAVSNGRRECGAAVSGGDVLALAIAGQVLPVDRFAALLAAADSLARPPQGARLLLSGNSQENAGLTGAIERLGGDIVAEDHDWGERLYDRLVEETPDPLVGLTAHYQFHAPGPRLPVEATEARFAALVEAARPDGVIFALEINDDTLGWDVPRRLRLLKERNVPALVLTGLSFFHEDPATAERIAGFLETLTETVR